MKQAEQIGADLIVMGTHGRRGLRRLALGSDAEQVVRLAGIPVLLVRGEASENNAATPGGKPVTVPAASLELG
jgi:hypothetical protein